MTPAALFLVLLLGDDSFAVRQRAEGGLCRLLSVSERGVSWWCVFI